MDPERIFHMEMSAIFHSVRDLHTNYLLPLPFAAQIAYLPFQVEKWRRRQHRCGANVWTHGLLKALRDVPPDARTPYLSLPKQADMRVSIRRTLRVGTLAGTPVEDLGVRPDIRHEMTRRDVLEGNVDLMEKAGSLAGLPRRRRDLTAVTSRANHLILQMTLGGLDRVDVYVDGRPLGSSDVTDGPREMRFDDQGGRAVVQVQGFAEGKLVAARTVQL